MLGNTLYGLSVLLKNPEVGQSEGSYLLHHLPWLVGSLGVLLLDTIVSSGVGGSGGQVAASVYPRGESVCPAPQGAPSSVKRPSAPPSWRWH